MGKNVFLCVLMTDDIAVYPSGESRLHDLYSADCPCHPCVIIEGSVLIFSHNKLVIEDLPKLVRVNAICNN